ncbi:Uncharacterised protein [Mycobacteroides abscessus subsp. massiliense]|nr:Uncharacterised protein [Mycobacteroides abscessus subsp. massiliense]
MGIPVACLIVTPLSGWFSRNYPRRKLVFLLYALQLPLLTSMTVIDALARIHPWLPPAQIIALSLSYTLYPTAPPPHSTAACNSPSSCSAVMRPVSPPCGWQRRSAMPMRIGRRWV